MGEARDTSARDPRPDATSGTEADRDAPEGAGGFVLRLGSFEVANGLPFGGLAIVLGLVIALILWPLRHVARYVLGR